MKLLEKILDKTPLIYEKPIAFYAKVLGCFRSNLMTAGFNENQTLEIILTLIRQRIK